MKGVLIIENMRYSVLLAQLLSVVNWLLAICIIKERIMIGIVFLPECPRDVSILSSLMQIYYYCFLFQTAISFSQQCDCNISIVETL